MRAVRQTNDWLSAVVESGESLRLAMSVILWWAAAILMDGGIWLWLHAALASTHPPIPLLFWKQGVNTHAVETHMHTRTHTHTHTQTHTHTHTHTRSLSLSLSLSRSSSAVFISSDTFLRPQLSQQHRGGNPQNTQHVCFPENYTQPSQLHFCHHAKWLIITFKNTLMT